MKLFVVVEGQGEEAAMPVLLRRIAGQMGCPLEIVGRPWREPRQRLLMRDHLSRILEVARPKAEAALVVLDADDECAVALANTVRSLCADLAPGFPVRVVCAVREFEAWFLAAAHSLRSKRGLPAELDRPEAPESIRDAKGWLSSRMATRYSPTLDQPALTAVMDLDECAAYSRSFRKLNADVRSLLGASEGASQ